VISYGKKSNPDIFKEGRLVEIKSKYDYEKYGVIIEVLSSSFEKQDGWVEFCYIILTSDGTFCYASDSAISAI
jgi:hypothetical protein